MQIVEEADRKLNSAARHQRDNYRSDYYYYFQSIFQSNILLLRSKAA